MAVRRRIRWAVRHGLIRRAVLKQMRAGAVGARLMMDPAARANPYPYYDQLRAQGRIVSGGIALTSAHHDVCRAVLRSSDFGCGVPLNRLPGSLRLAQKVGGRPVLGPVEPPSMLAVNPPEHTRYRKLVTRAFTPRAVAALHDRIEEIAEELLDEIVADGNPATVDLVARYASLLPATVIAEMLGAPVAMRRQFLDWGAGAALSLDVGLSYPEFRRAERDLAAMHRWMLGHFDELRRDPRDGILSALVNAHHDDGRLHTDELSSLAMLLLAAGFETTVNLLGNGVVLMLDHPAQLDLLRAEPQGWANAVEETLRYESPVQRTGRVALRDTEVLGRRVRGGSFIVLLLGGANRDPAVFGEPDRFDVRRPDAGEHLAFSSGVHYCLGAALARMEGEIGLRVLFHRFPDLTLAGPPQRRRTRVLRGYDTIPVRLHRLTSAGA